MSATAPTKFVIFDFDGTLFDTHRAIIHSITKTFATLLPAHSLRESDVQELIGSGTGLKDVLNTLHPDPSTLDEEKWTTTYRGIYATDGQQLVAPFDGAQHLLRLLQSRNIPIAIVSNKSVVAIRAALANHGMGDIIREKLIIGDGTPGVTRKPDPSGYYNALLPTLKDEGILKDADTIDVLVVGDTKADLQFASNIRNAKSVWCRFGYGDKPSCEQLSPDFTIDSLAELEPLLGVA